MDKTSPKIPVDLGNLRASFYIVPSKGSVKVGTTASFKGSNANRLSAGHSNEMARARSLVSSSKMPSVALGFSAYYAWYVHENVGANFQRPGAGAKYFEAALKRNRDKIVQIIRQEAKIK